MKGMQQLYRTIERVRAKLNAQLTIAGILPTIYKPRTLHSQEVLELVKGAFGDQVFDITIDSSIRFAETPLAGQSILQYAPSSPGARAYRALAKVLLNGSARAADAVKEEKAVAARAARQARAAKA
jgi:chromosome partitioning protein